MIVLAIRLFAILLICAVNVPWICEAFAHPWQFYPVFILGLVGLLGGHLIFALAGSICIALRHHKRDIEATPMPGTQRK